MARFQTAEQRKAVMAKMYRRLNVFPGGVAKTQGGTVLIPKGNMVQDLHGLSTPKSEGRKSLANLLKKYKKNRTLNLEFRGMTITRPKVEWSRSLSEDLNLISSQVDEMAFSSDRARKAFFAKKVKDVMHEWKTGKLRSGRSPQKGTKDTRKVVPKERRDWAVAIALNSARRSTDKMAEHRRVYTGGSLK